MLIATGHSTVDSAVEALKGGAIDYLVKPVDLKRLRKNLAHIREKSELRDEVVELRGELRRLGRFCGMIGASAPMQVVYDLIARVAPTDATVFVTGETGTGKELIARGVHDLSRRARKPLLPINCGAVSPTLLISRSWRTQGPRRSCCRCLDEVGPSQPEQWYDPVCEVQ